MDINEKIKKFAIDPKGFMILSGKNGTGKTTAAMKCYYRNTPYRLPERDDDRAIFITQAELNVKWKQDLELEEYLLDTLSNTKLMVLDDLGTKKPSDSFNDFLYALMDRRWKYRDEKGTVITTNLTSREIMQHYGKAFLSRVASGLVLTMEGEDHRLKHHGNDFKGSSGNYIEKRVLT